MKRIVSSFLPLALAMCGLLCCHRASAQGADVLSATPSSVKVTHPFTLINTVAWLPPAINEDYINVLSRVEPNTYWEILFGGSLNPIITTSPGTFQLLIAPAQIGILDFECVNQGQIQNSNLLWTQYSNVASVTVTGK